MGCGTSGPLNRKVAPDVHIKPGVHKLTHKGFLTATENNLAEATDECIKIWVGTLRLEGHVPSSSAISELLYGDTDNSAHGADVIVLFMTDLDLSQKKVPKLRGFLKECVDDSEKYIFNDTDAGLAIAGVPAQLAKVTEDGESFIAMYVGVHRRFSDINADSNFKRHSLTDVFPTPPSLGCGATSHGSKADEYRFSKSLMMQDVLLWPATSFREDFLKGSRSNSGLGNGLGSVSFHSASKGISPSKSAVSTGHGPPLHLFLCGANLSDDFGLQLHQLRQLMRHIDVRHRKTSPLAVLMFGQFNSRIVCDQDFAPHIQEVQISKKGGPKMPCWILKDSGVTEMCRRLSDPIARRELFLASSLQFSGVDCFGASHDKPPHCSQALTTLFDTNHSWVQRTGRPVPLPTYRRTPVDTLWSQALGFDVEMPDVVTSERLLAGADNLRVLQGGAEDLMELYFPSTAPETKTHSRVLKKNLGEALYMQVGWPDGIGAYRHGSCKAELSNWETLDDLMAFDHVPLKGSVQVLPSGKPPLRLWVGSVKLENRFPSQEALHHLLYDSAGASALGADVIALFFTDLEVTPKIVKKLQNLLYNTMKPSERDQYVFNEQQEGLVLRAIPVQLLKAQESGKPRYIALYVCVRRELVGDGESGLTVDIEDAFPTSPELICRSDMKNEAAPSFKGHMAQTVVIKQCDALHLLLVGLNFDTDDGARARQVERLERYLQSYQKQERHFAAVIFGDFNNRLVCPDWLAQKISWHGEGKVRGPVLKVEGARQLCSLLAEPARRLEVMRTLDSWFFEGVDAAGRAISVPTALRRLREMFQLHFELPLDEATIPLPTYKRSPIGECLSRQVGFPLEVRQLVTRAQLESGFQKLRSAMNKTSILQDIRAAYFGDSSEQRRIEVAGPHQNAVQVAEESRQVSAGMRPSLSEDGSCDSDQDVDSQGPPLLDCGWPDSIGVYKYGVQTQSEIVAWGICEKLLGGFDHVPVRATVHVKRTST